VTYGDMAREVEVRRADVGACSVLKFRLRELTRNNLTLLEATSSAGEVHLVEGLGARARS